MGLADGEGFSKNIMQLGQFHPIFLVMIIAKSRGERV